MPNPYSNRPIVPPGFPPIGMAHVSPQKRPALSPREYQARLDRLRVQDCLWARMGVTQIARHLGKDKAWVSRTIQRLQNEQATAYRTPREAELIGEHMGQLDSLLADTMAAVRRGEKGKTQLAAIRTAADLLRQKGEYQMSVGFVQNRERGAKGGKEMSEPERWKLITEQLPPSAIEAIKRITSVVSPWKKALRERRAAAAKAN